MHSNFLCALEIAQKLCYNVFMNTEKLKHLRKLRGISQERLAEEVGVSRQTVCRWENGRAVPRAEDVENICHALGVDYAELAEEAAVAETLERTSEQTPAQTNEQASIQQFLQKQAEEKKKKRRRNALIALCCLVPVLALALYICGEIAFISNKGAETVVITNVYFEPITVFWLLFAVLCIVLTALIVLIFLKLIKRKKQKNKNEDKEQNK